MILSSLGDSAADATIKTWTASLAGKVNDIDKLFINRSFTASEIYPEIDKSWNMATQFAETAKTMNNISSADVDDINGIALSLLELRGFFDAVIKGQFEEYPPSVYLFSSPNQYWQKALDGEKAPIQWLIRIGSPVLQTQADYNDLLKTAANFPSTAIQWTLDSILKALHLPTWLIPAIAITGIVGLGAWTYFTFLAPISHTTRRLANPRRRRRRYVRR